jgi:isoleucyl-tRNA synthetase
MAYKAEAQIIREIGKFLMNGSLYKGVKPVLWSPVEKTALGRSGNRVSRPHLDHGARAFPVIRTRAPSLRARAW